MIPAQIDIPCWANSDYMEDFAVTDGGVPVDLSEMVVRMECRTYVGGPVIFTAVTSVDFNMISIFLSRQVLTMAIKTGKEFSYDLLLIHPDDFQEIYAQGKLVIQNGVTQNG